MAMREYRKGNWTVEETMILIEAKKKDDERRKFMSSRSKLQTSPSTSGTSSSKPVTELRWKWVEEYCWARNCFRSQNQCNDKWDNLMRDYKKVRDYQKNVNGSKNNINIKSYWDMDKIERKEKGLPTNMLPQIYQALFEVVERPTSGGGGGGGVTVTTVAQLLLPPSTVVEQQQGSSSTTHTTPLPALQLSPSTRVPPSLGPHVCFHSSQQPSQPVSVLFPSSSFLETETSEQPPPPQQLSPAKKKRKGDGDNGGSGGGEGPIGGGTAQPEVATTVATTPASTSLQEVSSAISRSATIISEAIQASQEREERRHREMMSLHESRLRVEESRLETNRQGLNALSDAINRLATSIFTWVNSQKHQQGPS